MALTPMRSALDPFPHADDLKNLVQHELNPPERLGKAADAVFLFRCEAL